jgi:hypothetical protein
MSPELYADIINIIDYVWDKVGSIILFICVLKILGFFIKLFAGKD